MHHPTRQHRHLAHVSSFRDNPIVFVTTGTHQRKKLLANTQCHEILREIWEKSTVADGWCVGHYILMPDHVHLFARPAIDARPMAEWIKMWKSISSRKIAAALATSPPIWQADYFDRYLRSSENYSQKWHYVEQNARSDVLILEPACPHAEPVPKRPEGRPAPSPLLRYPRYPCHPWVLKDFHLF